MTKTADDGPAIADRHVRDMLHRFRNQRIGAANIRIEFKLAMARHRLDDNFVRFRRQCP